MFIRSWIRLVARGLFKTIPGANRQTRRRRQSRSLCRELPIAALEKRTLLSGSGPEFSADTYEFDGVDRHITQGTVVGSISASGGEGGLYYSGGDSTFSVNYDGSIVFNGSNLSAGTTYTFSVSVYDTEYGSDYATVEITTIPNNSPEFSSPENPDRYVIGGVDRHITQGTVVGHVSATDPDGDPLYYSGGDSMFTVNYDGSIVFNGSSLSPGTTYTFTASVYDDAYGSDYATVEITTIPNNSPEFTSPANPDRYEFSVSGNIAQGTVIGQVSATDADGDPIYYSGGDSNFSVQYDGKLVFTGYGLSSNTTYTLWASAYDDAYGSDYAEIVITTGQMGSGSQSGGSTSGGDSDTGGHSGNGGQSGSGSQTGGSTSGGSHTDDSGSGGSHTDDSASGGESDTGDSQTGGSTSGGEDSTSGGSHTDDSTSGGDSYSYGSDSGESESGGSESGGSDHVDAVDDDYDIASGTAAGNVSENDTGADQFWVTIEPEHGTVSMGMDGTFTYTADAGWTGADQFSYMAYGGEGRSDTAVVTLNGGGETYYVIANDDSVDLDDGVASGNVSVNDVGDSLTFTLMSDAEHGTLTFNSDGSFSYVADYGWTGGDFFQYIAYDGQSNSDTATVAINGGSDSYGPEFLMEGESDPQAKTTDVFEYHVPRGWSGTVGNLLAAVPNDPLAVLTFSVVGEPDLGPFDVNSFGHVRTRSNLTATPRPDGSPYEFEVTVEAQDGGIDTATVRIIVDGDPYAEAQDDMVTVSSQQETVINVLENDNIGDSTRIRILQQPSFGTVGIDSATGLPKYSPSEFVVTSVFFQYALVDSANTVLSSAFVFVEINYPPEVDPLPDKTIHRGAGQNLDTSETTVLGTIRAHEVGGIANSEFTYQIVSGNEYHGNHQSFAVTDTGKVVLLGPATELEESEYILTIKVTSSLTLLSTTTTLKIHIVDLVVISGDTQARESYKAYGDDLEGDSSRRIRLYFSRYTRDINLPLTIPVVVNWNGEPDDVGQPASAADFENSADLQALLSGSITFDAFQTVKVITLYAKHDTSVEGVESFRVEIPPPAEGETRSYVTESVTDVPNNGVVLDVGRASLACFVADGITLFASNNSDSNLSDGSGPINPNDVNQGKLEDCYVAATIAAVAASDPMKIRGLFNIPGGSIDQPLNGEIAYVRVSLWDPSTNFTTRMTTEIAFDLSRGMNAIELSGDYDQQGNAEVWPIFLEIAIAEAMGGYQNLVNPPLAGTPEAQQKFIYQLLTGEMSEIQVIYTDGMSGSQIYDVIDNPAHESRVLWTKSTATTTETSVTVSAVMSDGTTSPVRIAFDHAYVIMSYQNGTVTLYDQRMPGFVFTVVAADLPSFTRAIVVEIP